MVSRTQHGLTTPQAHHFSTIQPHFPLNMACTFLPYCLFICLESGISAPIYTQTLWFQLQVIPPLGSLSLWSTPPATTKNQLAHLLFLFQWYPCPSNETMQLVLCVHFFALYNTIDICVCNWQSLFPNLNEHLEYCLLFLIFKCPHPYLSSFLNEK